MLWRFKKKQNNKMTLKTEKVNQIHDLKKDTKTSKRYFIRKLLCVLCEIHLSLETEGVAVSSTADKV